MSHSYRPEAAFTFWAICAIGCKPEDGPRAKAIWGIVWTVGLIHEMMALLPALYVVPVRGEVMETIGLLPPAAGAGAAPWADATAITAAEIIAVAENFMIVIIIFSI